MKNTTPKTTPKPVAREYSLFHVLCVECGQSVGVTSCEITATNMALCVPCEDQD